MSKRKPKPDRDEAHGTGCRQSLAAAQKAEKRRQRAALYNRRPEVRERQKLRMAERRAATKAKRRQWDPPKQAPVDKRSNYMPPVSEALSGTSTVSPDPEDFPKSFMLPHARSSPAHSPFRLGEELEDDERQVDSASLNSAERFTNRVLEEMEDDEDAVPVVDAGFRVDISPPGSPSRALDDVWANSDLSPTRPEGSSSDRSGGSMAAVQNEPTLEKKAHNGYWTHGGTLPPAVSPASRKQKWLWREVGRLGPLTWVQEAQLQVANLACALSERSSASDGEEDSASDADAGGASGWSSEFVSRDVFTRIWQWRREHEAYTRDWDAGARRDFAEATLLQRAQYRSSRMVMHQGR
ncbi:hypothetical protein DFH07DRAFT_957808 [Mycena maculata]|uniref:Uncharacterized protein n=1 Tax=Mycena maculata TaxID=230809 RepID=A0AAD7NGS4_9AGAR|nr:hypothetical protein DFH07DRAFT_957808 [Mycena maculata]